MNVEEKQKDFVSFAIPILAVLFVIYVALFIAVSYENVKYITTQENTEATGEFNYGMFFEDLTYRMENNPYDIRWVDSSPVFLGIAAFICFIVYQNNLLNKKKLITGKEYGDAEWEKLKNIQHLFAKNIAKEEMKKFKKNKSISREDLKKIKHEVKRKYSNADMIFTRTEKICRYNFETNNNALIIGGSGSGKTLGVVEPNILQCDDGPYSPSLIFTDPKGGILARNGKFLKEQCKYEIKVLDLKELSSSMGYNPFKYIQHDKYESDIAVLAHNLMTRKEEEGTNDSPFWLEMAEVLLKALCFATYEGFIPEERNMETVIMLFRWFEVADDDDRYTNPTKLDDFFEVFAENEDIVAEFGDRYSNPALRAWEDFRTKCKGKTAQGVTSTLLSKISPFDEKEIRRIFRKDELELELVGERKTALFIIMPPTDTRLNFILTVLYTQLFQQLEYCATVTHKEEQKLPVAVQFYLDEFYNSGHIPNFTHILSYAREFGISIWPIIQSLGQLKELYEKSWEIILDNCDSMLYLGKIKSQDTLKYISELIGKATYDKESQSQSKGRNASYSVTTDKIGRELMDTSKLQRLEKDRCIFFLNGYNAFYSKKHRFDSVCLMKNFKYTGYASKKNMFHHSILRKQEEMQSKLPHGEEMELIRLETESEKVLEMINKNLLNFGFAEAVQEEVLATTEEAEELAMLAQIMKEEDESKKNIRNLNKSYEEVELIEDNERIANMAAKMLQEKEFIDFSGEEEYIDDAGTELNKIEEELAELQNNFIADDFLESLLNYQEEENIREEDMKELD